MKSNFKNIKFGLVIMFTTMAVWFITDYVFWGLDKIGVEIRKFQIEAQVGTDYYVDQDHSLASDSNPGTEDLPWETFGNFDNADCPVTAGDTVYVKEGIYKAPLRPVNPGTPENYITFKTFEDDEVIIEGSYEVTGWSQYQDNIYNASWDSSWLKTEWFDITGETGYVVVDYIFDDEHWLEPKTNVSNMTSGTWNYDTENKILYVWLSDSSNPNDHALLSTKSHYLSDNCIYLNRGTYEGASYIRFEGFKTRLCGHGLKVVSPEHHIEFKNIESFGNVVGTRFERGAEYISVENVNSHHNRGPGLQCNSAYTNINNSEFHHNGIVSWARWGAPGVILMGNNNILSHSNLHHNGFTGNHGPGIIIETWGTEGTKDPDTAHHNIVEYNEIHDNMDQQGISLAGGDYNTIRYNVIYNQNGGICLWEGGMGGETTEEQQKAKFNEIYNNVIVNPGYVSIRLGTNTFNSTVKNNLLYSNGNLHLRIEEPDAGHILDYNLYYGDAEFMWEGVWGYNLTGYQNVSNQDEHSFSSDPLFVNLLLNDFHLQPTSPAIDAGTDVNLTEDFDRGSVPQGSAPDIGAYEYIQTDLTPPILSNSSPSNTLPINTTQTTLSLTTNENATCKYSTTPNTIYNEIINTFTTTGGTTHSATVTGLSNGQSYDYYVRCIDTSNNFNTTDYAISFSVASSTITYNILDFAQLVIDWLSSISLTVDLNNDGIVNTRDLGIMMSGWEG